VVTVLRRISVRAAIIATLSASTLATQPGGAQAAQALGAPRVVAGQQAYSWAAAYGSRRDEYLVAYIREPGDLQRLPTSTIVQRVDRNGEPAGRAARVVKSPAGTGPLGQQIAYDSRRDEFLLVWRAQVSPEYGSGHEVYGQRLSAIGEPIGSRQTLVAASEQDKRRLQCCDELRVVHNPRNGGYLVAWRAERGRVPGPAAAVGRAVDPQLRGGPIRRLSGRTGVTEFDIAADPSGPGYLVAAWSSQPDGSEPALQTDRLTADGRRRGSATVVSGRGGGVRLAGREREHGYALAWGSSHVVRVQPLDPSGHPLGGTRSVRPHGRYTDVSPTAIAYNPRADQFVLGWHGSFATEDHRFFNEPALRSLGGDRADPLGPTFLPKGDLGPLVVASTRDARWLVLSSSDPGALYAQAVGPQAGATSGGRP
jgi:hypothetical protein